MKAFYERLLLASRWLLTPFYVALALALLALLAKVVERVYELATQFLDLTEEQCACSPRCRSSISRFRRR